MTKEITNVSYPEMVELLKKAPYRVDADLTPHLRVDGEQAKQGLRSIRVKMRKDPAPRKGDKGQITQIGEGGLHLNVNWDNRRADFGLPPMGSERSWGQRVAGTPLVEHKGEFYLTAAPITTQTAGAVGTVYETRYETVDGTPLVDQSPGVPHELVVSICRQKKDGSPLSGYDRAGRKIKTHAPTGEVVEASAEYRDFKLSSMDEITVTLGGVTYQYAK